MIDYKVLMLDIDGTLLNSEKKITDATRTALHQAQERGVTIVLASGRPPCGILPIARELGLAKTGGYMVAFNGGLVIECSTGKTILETPLPHWAPGELAAAAHDCNLPIMTYLDNTLISEHPQDAYVQKEAHINHIPVRSVEDFAAFVTFPTIKCLIAGEPELVAQAEQKLAQQYAGRLSVFRSEPFFLELMNLGVDKAQAIPSLCQTLGIQNEQVIACGDGYNDIGMIRHAGLGVAMENAQSAAKEVADIVTASNDADGIVQIVQKYIL